MARSRKTHKSEEIIETGALLIASMKPEESDAPPTAMFSLNHTSVVKCQIATLRKAGVSPIIVLCGYQKETIQAHLVHNGVIFLEDPFYKNHTLSEAIAYGIEQTKEICPRLLLIPAEYPVFQIDTVLRLMKCRENTIPMYDNENGYPILHVQGSQDHFRRADRIQLDDPGITLSLKPAEGSEALETYIRNFREHKKMRIKTKVVLTKEDDFFGPGILYLLEAIEETGSIQAAVEKMGMSYSKGWKMINKAENQMGFPFIERMNGGKKGGRSTITPEGKLFMERYEMLMRDIRRISDNFFEVYFKEY